MVDETQYVKVSFVGYLNGLLQLADLEILFNYNAPNEYFGYFGGNDEFNIGDDQLGHWPSSYFDSVDSSCNTYTWSSDDMIMDFSSGFIGVCLANTCGDSLGTNYCGGKSS